MAEQQVNASGPDYLGIASIRRDVEQIREAVAAIHDELALLTGLVAAVVVLGVIAVLLEVWL